MVDEIEVSALTAPHLDRDDIFGRAVELLDRKGLDDRGDLTHGERDDDVNVMGHARLAVDDSGGAARHHVRDADAFEPRDERLERARWRHAGRSFARARSPAHRSNPGEARAHAPRATAGRTSTAG